MYLLQGGVTLISMFALTGTLGRLGHRRAYSPGGSLTSP